MTGVPTYFFGLKIYPLGMKLRRTPRHVYFEYPPGEYAYPLDGDLSGGYLTIIPLARVGYEVVNSQRGAKRRVGYNHSYPTRANGIIVLLNSS